MIARMSVTFQSLTVRNYRLFALGHLFRTFCFWTHVVAQDWLVLELSNDSASVLGMVTGMQFLPVLLLTLYGGKLADRHDRRHLLIWANLVSFVLGLTLGVLVSAGLITLPLVFAFAASIGIVNAIEPPARQAFVSELVEPGLMPNALALSAAMYNASRIVGPAVAGVGIWLVGLGPVFLTIGISYLFPPLLLMRMEAAQLYRSARPTERPRIRDGLVYTWRRHDLLLPLALLFVVGLIGFNFPLTLAVLAKVVFTTGPQQFGLLTSALAVGALLGALASGARRHRPNAYTVIAACIAFGVMETLTGFGPTLWATAALLVPTGFFTLFLLQATNQSLQLGVGAEYRGRVMAMFILVNLGTTPVGGPIMGFVIDHLGPRAGLWSGGVVSILAAVGALVWQLRRVDARLRLKLRPLPTLVVVPRAATDEAPPAATGGG